VGLGVNVTGSDTLSGKRPPIDFDREKGPPLESEAAEGGGSEPAVTEFADSDGCFESVLPDLNKPETKFHTDIILQRSKNGINVKVKF
jgi:hypothetical protein